MKDGGVGFEFVFVLALAFDGSEGFFEFVFGFLIDEFVVVGVNEKFAGVGDFELAEIVGFAAGFLVLGLFGVGDEALFFNSWREGFRMD